MHMLRKNQEKPVTVTERVNVEHIGQEFEPGRRWPGTRSTSSKPVTNAKLNSSQIAEMCTNVLRLVPLMQTHPVVDRVVNQKLVWHSASIML
jgi:hypothetical protein